MKSGQEEKKRRMELEKGILRIKRGWGRVGCQEDETEQKRNEVVKEKV